MPDVWQRKPSRHSGRADRRSLTHAVQATLKDAPVNQSKLKKE